MVDVLISNRTAFCWCINIDNFNKENMSILYKVLSKNEQDRANRYKHELDYQRFVISRSVLRLLLSSLITQAPEQIEFVVAPEGKPLLKNSEFEFNISHSENIILIAISYGFPIGVDVEYVRERLDHNAIIQNYFHPDEIADFEDSSEAEAKEMFFRCWTRKEAVAKALGKGLFLPLNQYRVTCRNSNPSALLTLLGQNCTDNWSVIDLAVPNAYRAAIAAPVSSLNVFYAVLDVNKLLREYNFLMDLARSEGGN